MVDANLNLMLEILKQIQSDIGTLKRGQEELKVSAMGIREDIHGLNGEIHSLGGRILNLEKSSHSMDVRLQRIEKRLDLIDA